MRKQRDDPNQTLINWSNPVAAIVPVSSISDPVKLAAQAAPPLIERLPWDFTTTFPQPTDEAIDNGVLNEGEPIDQLTCGSLCVTVVCDFGQPSS